MTMGLTATGNIGFTGFVEWANQVSPGLRAIAEERLKTASTPATMGNIALEMYNLLAGQPGITVSQSRITEENWIAAQGGAPMNWTWPTAGSAVVTGSSAGIDFGSAWTWVGLGALALVLLGGKRRR